MTSVRILTLPGFAENAHIMQAKMDSVRKTVGKDVDFVYLDPPHVIQDPTFRSSLAPFDSFPIAGEAPPANAVLRSWSDDSLPSQGFDQALEYVRDFLKDAGTFDGILGYSQGGAMAALLVALSERPELHPLFKSNPIAPFKFAIFVGGFIAQPKTYSFDSWFPIKETPTLHILGRNDVVITNDRSIFLADRCLDARIIWHEGGHYVPTRPSFRQFLKEYISSFSEGYDSDEIPSPRIPEMPLISSRVNSAVSFDVTSWATGRMTIV